MMKLILILVMLQFTGCVMVTFRNNILFADKDQKQIIPSEQIWEKVDFYFASFNEPLITTLPIPLGLFFFLSEHYDANLIYEDNRPYRLIAKVNLNKLELVTEDGRMCILESISDKRPKGNGHHCGYTY